MTELPLRIIDQPGGAIIRCLCGLEAGTMRKGLAAGSRMAASGTGRNPYRAQLAPDLTTPGLMMMVVHALKCERGNVILEGQQRACSGLLP